MKCLDCCKKNPKRLLDPVYSGMDTGRVDPRVGRIGSGRVTRQHQGKFGGSGRVETSEMRYFVLYRKS